MNLFKRKRIATNHVLKIFKLDHLIFKRIETQLKIYYYLLTKEKDLMKNLEFKNVFTLNRHFAQITALSYIRDYDINSVISISKDKSMIIWDITTGKHKKEFKKHSGGLTSIAHMRDLGNNKTHVAIGSEDKKIYVWDLNKNTDKPFLLRACFFRDRFRLFPKTDKNTDTLLSKI